MKRTDDYRAIRYCTKCGKEYQGEYRRDCPSCGGSLDTTYQELYHIKDNKIKIFQKCIKCGKETPKLLIQCIDGTVFEKYDNNLDKCPLCGGVWHTFLDNGQSDERVD